MFTLLDMASKDSGQGRKQRKTCGRICAAIGCHNQRCNSDASLFQFPKDKERYDSKIVLSSSTLSQKKLLTIQREIKNITFLQVQKMDCKHKTGGSRWVHY